MLFSPEQASSSACAHSLWPQQQQRCFTLRAWPQPWERYIANLKQQVGDCDTAAPVSANSALSGEFTWRCMHGRLTGSVTLAPTRPPRIQQIELNRKAP